MAKTIHQKLFDGQVMHVVTIRRLEEQKAKLIGRIARASLKENLEKIVQNDLLETQTTKGRKELQRLIRQAENTAAAFSGATVVFKDIFSEMSALADYEVAFQGRLLKTAFAPLVLSLQQPSASSLKTLVKDDAFLGGRLAEWKKQYSQSVIRNTTRSMRLAYFQGEGQAGLARRLTASGGVLYKSQRAAEAVARTALNAAANRARDSFQKKNRVSNEYRYSAVIDGRTTLICSSRDGNIYKEKERPMLPAHVNCRSLYIQIIDKDAVFGERSTVLSTKTSKQLNKEWRNEAAAKGRSLKSIRDAWYSKNVGSVPAKTNFQQWLSGQSAAFQIQYLGNTRAALFRKGGLDLKDFVTRAGRRLTLKELKRRDADAFRLIGL